LDKQTYFHF